ncbi:NUDIX domain-containing protein [Lutibacter sp. A64]|uniref:NUDIX hydrolase n=1 Tax=Lutibacter sp. A64 TaxID=2918526 RepID=UPI001F05859E|nr:NUDIX domain-containing protein [Lutibacter sp. A64]UMB54407.1 NUDIX domain-containing protein [Lutibacter sp. A64]
MDEYIDLLNNTGKPNGTTCLKSEAHKKGLFHASAHIWIFNNNKEVLIQKRASNKETFPNLWDVSVAGHISAGEKPIVSALREVEEEIGLIVKPDNLYYIGTSKKRIEHKKDLIDNELHHIYICNINFDINSLKIQTEEVSEIKSITFQSLIEAVNSKNNNFVPHGKDYYNFVFNAIKNTLSFK